MIHEKKLIREMWDRYNGHYNNASRFSKEETEMANRVLSDLQKSIDKQPKVGQWIPCSERLPYIQGVVLVQRGTFAEGKPLIQIAEYTTRREGFFKKEKGFYEPYHSMPWKYDDVIAWMPLPEPYKESEG